MKEYMLNIVSNLEAWAENVDGPYERCVYNVGDYAMMAVGSLKRKNDPTTEYLYFGTLIHLLNNKNFNFANLEKISFAISLAQIIKSDKKDGVQATWVKLEKGAIIDFSDVLLTLNDKNHIHGWAAPDLQVEYVNLEYMLSVILYHTSLFRNFKDILIGIFSEIITDENMLNEINDRFIAINKKVKPNDIL